MFPPFAEREAPFYLARMLSVSLEHVNMIIWVLFIVNDRGCLRLQFALLQLAWGIPKEVLVGML